MRLKPNLLRKGLKGKALLSAPLYKFIYERNIDWAVILACVLMPLPYIASQTVQFFIAKLVLASFMWALGYIYVRRSKMLLSEQQLFSSLISTLKSQMTFKSVHEIRDALSSFLESGLQSSSEIISFTEELGPFCEEVRRLVERIESSGLEAREFIDKNWDAPEIQTVILRLGRFPKIVSDMKEVAGLANLYVLILSINELRRAISVHWDLYRVLILLLAATFVFFTIFTAETSAFIWK
jgi:hypothetical protein